jgi:hypothetical protein
MGFGASMVTGSHKVAAGLGCAGVPGGAALVALAAGKDAPSRVGAPWHHTLCHLSVQRVRVCHDALNRRGWREPPGEFHGTASQ